MRGSRDLISVLIAGLAPRVRALTTVDATGGSRGFLGVITESFAGAWQRGITVDSPRDVLAFSAVFACVTTIAGDIAKLRVLLEDCVDGIFSPVSSLSPYWPVLRKPNHFQTWIEFVKWWIVCKLLWGNAYVLKQRDARRIVTALYILDPQRVTPLITEDGDVYYRLMRDDLAGVGSIEDRDRRGDVVVPASEIIHDKMACLWHPLVGVSPIYACGMSATMGNRIQRNSTGFFGNMSMPGGVLTSDQKIDEQTAKRMKLDWEANYTGNNAGRIAVLGAGLKYETPAVPPRDAQLVEQLKWSVEDVARCFKFPLYKIGGAVPGGASLGALNQSYYNDCLHELIASMELCLKEGLELPTSYHANIDEEGLLRMDKAARFESYDKGISAGWMKPNEVRSLENFAPVEGGDTPYMQQQNYSLAALAKRDAREDPFTTSKPAPAEPAPEPSPDSGKRRALPAPGEDEDDDAQARYQRDAAELLAHIAKGLECPGT